MSVVTISGFNFSFSAQLEHLSAAGAQDIMFAAMSKLIDAERLIRDAEGTKFDVILRSFGEGRKIYIIKEIRSISGIGLKEAKEISEALPAKVAEKVTAKNAAQIVKVFQDAGGTVDMVEAA